MLHNYNNVVDNNNHIQQHSHSAKMDKYWPDSPNQSYDRNLNFAAIGSEDDDYASFSKSGGSKGSSNINKAARDPQSHRIIEKRRRDRMNNCLADLSRLLPPACMKKGRGRIEKTEIIEMTIKHMKHLQIHACKDIETCEIALQMEQNGASKADHYRSGFLECITETMDYISHHLPASKSSNVNEEFCSKLFAHLHSYCDKTTSRLVDGTGSEAGDVYPTTGRTTSHHGGGIITHEDDATRGSESSPLPPVQVTLTELHGSERKEDQVYYNGDVSKKVHHRPSSGSVSGGDSDETNRSDRATRSSNSPCPMEDGSPSGPSPPGCNGDGESYNSSHSGGSQHSSGSSSLRQMLLSNGEETSTRTKSCSSSSTSSSSRSSVVHSSSNQNDDSNSTYKKFKTNIHQRFTADLEHVVDFQHSSSGYTTNQSESKKENQRTFDDTTAVHGQKRKKLEHEDERHNNTFWTQNGFPGVAPLSPPSSSSTRASVVGPEILDSRILQKHLETVVVGQPQSLPAAIPTPSLENVPIFALHPKGAYYVPMSVEMNMIRGLFHTTENQSAPLLHPVTISVNFCHPVQVLATPAAVIPPPPPSIKVVHQDAIMPALRPVLSPPLLRHQLYEMEESSGHRQHARESTAQLKMAMQHRAAAEYGHHQHQSSESVLRREYPVIRQSRGDYHHQQQQHNGGNNSLTHSSRWSHLMAKRTHTP